MSRHFTLLFQNVVKNRDTSTERQTDAYFSHGKKGGHDDTKKKMAIPSINDIFNLNYCT